MSAEPVHVLGLEAEDFMRLKVVRVQFSPTGITKIVGKNGAGKTSLINALAACLGGRDQKVETPVRKGQRKAVVVADLGDMIVRKTWNANGDDKLEITNKDGEVLKSPQVLLNRLIGELTFDPLSFTKLKGGDQAAILAKLANIDLRVIQEKKKAIFEQRRMVGRDRDTCEGAYKAIVPVQAPDEEVDVKQLTEELSRREGVNRNKEKLKSEYNQATSRVIAAKKAYDDAGNLVSKLEKELEQAKKLWAAVSDRVTAADDDQKGALEDFTKAPEENTDEVKLQLANSQQINRDVRNKKDRALAKAKADRLSKEYDDFTAAIEQHDKETADRISNANLPVPGLGLEDDGVTLNGIPFTQASQAEQLRTSVAIGLALNPKLKVCLIRDGSLLDADSMNLIAKMAEEAGAQVLVERVAGSGESGILIEDGEVVANETEAA